MTSNQQQIVFTLPIGSSKKEAIGILQAITRSCSDVFIQATGDDCSINEETVDVFRNIYFQADSQLRKLGSH